MRYVVEEFREVNLEHPTASAAPPLVLSEMRRKHRARERHALALKARAVVVDEVRRQGREQDGIAPRVLQDHIGGIQGADKAPASSLVDDEFEALSRPVRAVNQALAEGGTEMEPVAGDALYR